MTKQSKENARPRSRNETEKAPSEGGLPVSGINEAPASERPQYKGAAKDLGETNRGFVSYNTPPETTQDQREYRPSSATAPAQASTSSQENDR